MSFRKVVALERCHLREVVALERCHLDSFDCISPHRRIGSKRNSYLYVFDVQDELCISFSHGQTVVYVQLLITYPLIHIYKALGVYGFSISL